jgi:tetratricopeptide (TPR) repeat protein
MLVGSEKQALSAMLKIANEQPDDPLVQMSYSSLLSMAGNKFESAKVNQRVLEDNPDFLRALFNASFRHLSLNNLKVADELLSRVEAIAPERAYDDRFTYCVMTEDKACYQDSGQRYLNLLKRSGSSQSAVEFEAQYALYMNKPGRSIELLEPGMNALIDNQGLVNNFSKAYVLAVAYDKEGLIDKRDRVLDSIEATVQVSLSNGIWPRLIAEELFTLAAIRGDTQLAAERLALAIDSDASPASIEINHSVRFEKVRNDPAVKAQIERLKAKEDELRERLYAEGIW